MNKEQQELLDEAYDNYCNSFASSVIEPHAKHTFIDKCKCNIEFSQRWGLKIEERELFKLERINVAIEKKLTHKTAHLTKDFDYQKWCDEQNIPTKLITITYNDKTIESYE
jgi:hypothetical protein